MRSRAAPELRLAFVSPKPWRVIGITGVAVAIVALCALGVLYKHAQDAVASAETELARMRRASALQAKRAEISPELRTLTEEEVVATNAVIRRLSLPWEDLFAAIEASTDDDVVLISIEPETEKGSVTVTAEARSAQAMTDYGQRLASSARFGDVRIQSHQVQMQDPQKPVRFTLLARWLIPANAPRRVAGGAA